MIQLGQIVIDTRYPKHKYVFVGFKGRNLEIAKPGKTDFSRYQSIKPTALTMNWKALDEFDMETVKNCQAYTMKMEMEKLQAKQQVLQMQKGQIFKDNNGEEFAFVEMKRTRLTASKVRMDNDGNKVAQLMDGEYSVPVRGVKEITNMFAEQRNLNNMNLSLG